MNNWEGTHYIRVFVILESIAESSDTNQIIPYDLTGNTIIPIISYESCGVGHLLLQLNESSFYIIVLAFKQKTIVLAIIK